VPEAKIMRSAVTGKFILHKRPNGDVWVVERGSLPGIFKDAKVGKLSTKPSPKGDRSARNK
jgi:hypothetical protein